VVARMWCVRACVLRGLPRNTGSEGGEARSAGKERRSGARGACLLAAAAEAQAALHLTAPDVVTHIPSNKRPIFCQLPVSRTCHTAA
jgi:hypothetical protein